MGGVGLGVDADQLIEGGLELAHRYGRLPTQTRLQDGVMDEYVLLLKGTSNTYMESRTHMLWKAATSTRYAIVCYVCNFMARYRYIPSLHAAHYPFRFRGDN